MFRVLLALLAIVALLVAAESASAHGGAVVVRDAFGNVRVVQSGYGFYGPQQFRAVHPQFRSFHNRSFFNQDGGRNRIGRRR